MARLLEESRHSVRRQCIVSFWKHEAMTCAQSKEWLRESVRIPDVSVRYNVHIERAEPKIRVEVYGR